VILFDSISQDDFASDFAGEFEFCCSEVEVGWDDGKTRCDLLADLSEVGFAAEQVVDAQLVRLEGDTEVQRRVGLWVEIENTDFLAALSQPSGEIDGGGSFSHTSFLIDNSNLSHGNFRPIVRGKSDAGAED
jgi:hypothetical protein